MTAYYVPADGTGPLPVEPGGAWPGPFHYGPFPTLEAAFAFDRARVAAEKEYGATLASAQHRLSARLQFAARVLRA